MLETRQTQLSGAEEDLGVPCPTLLDLLGIHHPGLGLVHASTVWRRDGGLLDRHSVNTVDANAGLQRVHLP